MSATEDTVVTVKTGWLVDKDRGKFAPKTLSSQIQTTDGILLEDKIKSDLDVVKTTVEQAAKDYTDAQIASAFTSIEATDEDIEALFEL